MINKNRLTFIYFCITIAFLILILRLFFLVAFGNKIAVGNFYDNHKLRKRGDIIDCNNIILATDLRAKALYVNSALIRDAKLVAHKLTASLPNSSYNEILRKISNKENLNWILIARNITPNQQKEIQNLKIAGLIFDNDLVRVYPQKSILSHLVGYVDVDRNGLAGIEKEYNDRLKFGDNIKLAMDVRVQDILEDQLIIGINKYNAAAAAGIVMNVNNGEIIALSSLPNFGPNHQEIAKNDQLFNRATQGVYEPGSIFKIFTDATAFENNLIKISDSYNVAEPIKHGRFTISDYHPIKDQMSVEEIFIYSSNIGTVKIAQKIGIDRQKNFLKKINLLDSLETDFPGLAKPIYPRQWKEINLFTISYGHGIAVTPLHIATTVAAIANGGILYQPSFIKLSDKFYGRRVIKEQTSEIMKKLLRKVTTDGTGRNADIEGYEVGGKTGTSNYAEEGRYNEHKTMASFAAIFPISNPQYLVYVMFDRPNSDFNTGGMVAAPVAGKIVKDIAPILGVMPIAKINLDP